MSRDTAAPHGHAYEYPGSFCECGHMMAEPWHEYDKHILDVTSDDSQLPLAAVMAPVPNKPKTPVSNFRIPPKLKAAAQAKARDRGESLTDVVVKALERYVRSKR